MNARAIPRTAVESYLRLVRLPLDGAVGLLPGNRTGAKPAAKLALDRADATLRAVIATILRDPALREDAGARGTAERAHARWPSDDAKTAHTDARGHEQQEAQQRERSSEDVNRRRQAAGPKDQRRAAKVNRESPGAAKATEEIPLAGHARADRVKTVSAVFQTPSRKAEELARSRSTDGPETSPAQREAEPSAQSHRDIADRAYELYRRGVPGDADAHWLAAEREVVLVSE